MKRPAAILLGALLACAAAPVWPQAAVIGQSASITVGDGPHKGRYDFAPTQACVIASFGDKPPGVSVVLSSEQASLSIDVPNIDAKHASEIQIMLIVSDKKAGQTGKGAASVTYEIDTRPDAVLAPFQKAERANKGVSGKATTTLMQEGARVLLSFSGETALGVKMNGEVSCQRA